LNDDALRRCWGVAILALAAFIIVSSLSPQPIVTIETLSDKAGHGLAYFSLALLASGITAPGRLRLAMLRCFLLGAALELAQAQWTAERQAEWGDLAANTAGILVAWLISAQGRAGWGYRLFARLRHGRSS
jgi:VanZ family protein